MNVNNLYPIFIIGLPRCGSTLIESIISSGNDKVQNLGETNLINWAFINSNGDFTKSFNKEELVETYLYETSEKLLNAIKNLEQINFCTERRRIFYPSPTFCLRSKVLRTLEAARVSAT